MGELQKQVREFRQGVLREDAATAEALLSAYAPIRKRLDREIKKVTNRIAEIRKDGDVPSVAMLTREGRLQRLRDQVDGELVRWTKRTGGVIDKATARAAKRGERDALGLADTATPDKFKPVLAREAIEDLRAATLRGAPVRALLAQESVAATARLTETLLEGIALGSGPAQIAREMRDVSDMPISRAMRIARTETLRAYRSSTQSIYQLNDDVLDGWVWVAGLDNRTCASCVAQHGKVFPLNEEMASHPNCRCVMAPYVPGVDYGQDGPSWFAEQDEEMQRAILGKGGLEGYKKGELKLDHFVARRDNPIWGATTRQAALREARLNAGLKAASPRGKGDRQGEG